MRSCTGTGTGTGTNSDGMKIIITKEQIKDYNFTQTALLRLPFLLFLQSLALNYYYLLLFRLVVRTEAIFDAIFIFGYASKA